MANPKKPSRQSGDAACFDCEKDPIGKLNQMFVDIVQTRRIQLGQSPARRPVFLKPHGVAHGHFEVRRDLPADLKIGYTQQINNMIAHYGSMGVVEVREGPKDREHFPPVMEVEDLGPQAQPALLAARADAEQERAEATHDLHGQAEQVDLSGIEKVRRFPHGLRR